MVLCLLPSFSGLHIDTTHDEFYQAIWEEALELHQGLVG